mgnify:CR=1 FL=1
MGWSYKNVHKTWTLEMRSDQWYFAAFFCASKENNGGTENDSKINLENFLPDLELVYKVMTETANDHFDLQNGTLGVQNDLSEV